MGESSQVELHYNSHLTESQPEALPPVQLAAGLDSESVKSHPTSCVYANLLILIRCPTGDCWIDLQPQPHVLS